MIIRISTRTALLLECQRALFRQKFGREAQVEDPIFFDPDGKEPQPIITEKHASEPIEQLCQRLSNAGVDPAFLFAIRKTMQLGMAAPPSMYREIDVGQWLKAVDEYHQFANPRKLANRSHVSGDGMAEDKLILSI